MGLVATWKEDENVDAVGSIELNEIFDQIDRTTYVTCLFSVKQRQTILDKVGVRSGPHAHSFLLLTTNNFCRFFIRLFLINDLNAT